MPRALRRWAPGCGITQVVVEREAAAGQPGGVVWSFSVLETRPVGPSVRYAQLPSGAQQDLPPVPLVRGATYRVTLRTTVGGDVLVGGESAAFTF